jgi:hypothetical protein
MTKSLFISLASIGFFVALTGAVLSDNGKAGYTNSPSEGNCTSCHNSFAANSGPGSVALLSNIGGDGYLPGVTYDMTLRVKQSTRNLFGLGVEALTTANQNAGTLIITNSAKTRIANAVVMGVSRHNVTHQLNGGASTDSMRFAFGWTAPAAGTGNVTFYYSGLAANANGQTSGDYVYTGSTTFPEFVDHTGIAQSVTNIKTVVVYPNPVKERVNLHYSLTSASEVCVSLYNMEGKMVKFLGKSSKPAGISNDSFEIGTDLATGTYSLELRTDKGVSTQKVMIQ